MAKEDLTLNIKADVRKATAEIKKINKTLEEFKKEQQKIAKESLNSAKSIENFTNRLTQMAHITAGLAGLDMTLGKIVEVGEAFEKSISKLGAISKASSEDLAILSDKAKELGLKTQYSAKQVADAMNYEAMAGMKTNEILTATKDILDLASVGQMDLAQASDIATDTMSAFGMSADEVGKITDVMAVTITNSNTNVEQLGEAFKNVAPVAHNLGLSIEQTSAMLGVLADSGRKGGEAGTHLKIILQRLSSSTEPVTKGLEKLGLSAYDSNGKLKPLDETLKNIKIKLDGLSDKEKNEVLKDLFGEEAIASANILLNNLDSMDNKLKDISNSAGNAAKMAKEMNDNLQGDWDRLKSALSETAITLYEELTPALRDVTQDLIDLAKWLTEAIKNTSDFYKENKVLIDSLAEVGVALLAVTKVKDAFSGLKDGIDIIKSLSTAIGLLGSSTAIFTALATAIATTIVYIDNMQESTEKLNTSSGILTSATENISAYVEELYSNLDKTTGQLNLTNEEIDNYEAKTNILIKSLEKQIEVVKQNSDGSDKYKNIIKELNKKLDILKQVQKDLEKSKIKESFEKNAKGVETQKEAITKLNEEQEKYLEKLEAQLQKEKQKNQTLQEWYQAESETLENMLQGTQEYYEAKEKLLEIYKEKLNDSYEKRIEKHQDTIDKLKEKEQDLSDKIIKTQEDLQNKLKKLEQDRVDAIEDIEDKIHKIELSNASDYEKYVDKKKQAEIALAKAKEELRNGDLEHAKKYMNEYESLVTNLANTEIKENGKVKVTKEESNAVALNGLKELENLTNEYYTKEKEQAIEVHNQKIEQLQAQLTATKSQLELEVQRLNLEKEMIELLTGKEIDIDTSSALNSIQSLDNQIKNLDNQIKSPKKVKVDTSGVPNKIDIKINADYKDSEKRLNKEIQNFTSNPIETEITADTQEAEHSFLEVRDYVTGDEVVFDLDANNQKVKNKIDEVEEKVNNSKPTIKINDNVKDILNKTNDLKNKINSTKPTLTIKTNIEDVLNKIAQLKKPTSSTHTIYIKEVKKKAIGGLIEPIRLATGGSSDFKRVQGRIPGYDPNDSDDVPALLTRGEFVIKRDAVKHYGDDFLYKLNNKMLPKFADGGLVDNIKTQINEIASLKGISISDEVINSTDLTRLKKYLQSLENLKILDLDDIQDKYNNYVTTKINEQRKYRYSQTGMFLAGTSLDKTSNFAPNSEEFLTQLGIKENLNIPMSYDFREYGKEYKLSEDWLSKINNEYLQEHLPKFATGGLVVAKDTQKLVEQLQSNNNYKIKDNKISKNELLSQAKEELSNLPILQIDKQNLNELKQTFEIFKIENFSDKLTNNLKNKFQNIENSLNKISKIDKGVDELENKIISKKNYALQSNSLKEVKKAISFTKSWQKNVIASQSGIDEPIIKIVPKINKLIEKLKKDFEILKAELQKYKKELQKYKNMIKDEFQRIGVNMIDFVNPTKLDTSMDLNRLKRYYSHIKTIPKLTKDNQYILKSIPKFQTGGAIDGLNGGKLPGYGGGDRNLALLEDGEFVIRKEAVKNYGAEFLHSLNSIKLPKFQFGGMVDFNNLPKFNTGGEVSSGYTANINFTMPSGKSYEFNGNESAVKAFSQELRRVL